MKKRRMGSDRIIESGRETGFSRLLPGCICRYAWLLLLAVAFRPPVSVAQQPDLPEAKQEVLFQSRQDQALKEARQEMRAVGYKPAVRKQMELGKAAYSLEQYAIAFDRYLRAYEKEQDSARRLSILYALGQSQQKLNHAQAAALYYTPLWKSGVREPDFLQAYTEVLFSLGDYGLAEEVLGVLEKENVSSPIAEVRRESIRNLVQAAEMQEAFGLLPRDVYFDSSVNTAFSEYGPSLVLGQLFFSSSRPQPGQTVSDPRTGQGYSRLYSASFDPVRKAWSGVQPLQGVLAGLRGNTGTFSYDSVRNTGYFTWNEGTSSGIYTVQRQADGTWENLQQFVFNYKEGGDDFLGKVAHPSVSKDGNRLLFVYRDAARPTGTDIWYVERNMTVPEPSAKGRRRVASPSQQSASRGTSRRRRNESTVGRAVIVNAEWGLPARYSELVNTPGREVFPQWINDTMFVFSSDGHPGYGGTDLYLAVLDSADRSQVRRVNTFPMPVNSSYDDNALLPDPAHGLLLLSSNRFTNWGWTDNLFHLRTWGVKYEVKGYVAEDMAADTLPDSLAGTRSFAGLPKLKDYYLMVRNPETDFFQSVLPDSTGQYAIPFLEPGNYEFTLHADGFTEVTRSIHLEKDGQMMPVLVGRELDFTLRPEDVRQAAPIQERSSRPIQEPEPDTGPVSPAIAVQPPVPDKEIKSLTPREIIADIDSKREFRNTLDTRYVDDYKKRVNDPLRRAKLTVVPATAKCEVCGDEPQWKRNVGDDFFVKAGDDKALITLTDQQGHVSYVDLAPNSAYSIQVQVVANGNMPKLPAGISQDDIRKTVVTRDYILFECVPKLSELNDETYVNNVYFDFDREELVKDGPRELDRMIIIALKNPQMYFQIEAHADERGSAEYNRKLTDRRLETVTSYVEKKGMDMRRVIGKSYGESDPLIPYAATEQEHRLNRRTTFRLLNPKAVNVKRGDKTYPAPEVSAPVSDEVRFMVQVGAFRIPLDNPLDYYQDIIRNNPDFRITYYMDADGLYKYNVGEYYTDLEQARSVVKRLLDQNRDCYIAAFYKGRRITVSEASAVLDRRHQ